MTSPSSPPAPAEKKKGGGKGPKTYATLPDGALLSVKIPLGGVSSLAALHSTLLEGIATQLRSDGNESMASQVGELELEVQYLPSLESAPESVTEGTDLSLLEGAKAIKVTFKDDLISMS